MKEYTKRRNLNRGYMKLEVWQRGMEMVRFVWRILNSARIDLKLRSQLSDAALSVPANIAEGYSRRSVTEYMYHVNVALGSLSEVMTRTISLKEQQLMTDEDFEGFDSLHYEIENKLLGLLRSLQEKARNGSWETDLAGTTESENQA